MLEPVTTIAAVAVTIRRVERFLERRDRARQRGRLLSLAGYLPPGSVVGESYDGLAGWWVVVPQAGNVRPR